MSEHRRADLVETIPFRRFENDNLPISDLKGRARKNAWSLGAESFFVGVDRSDYYNIQWIRDAYDEGFDFARRWSHRNPRFAVACNCCGRPFQSEEGKLR